MWPWSSMAQALVRRTQPLSYCSRRIEGGIAKVHVVSLILVEQTLICDMGFAFVNVVTISAFVNGGRGCLHFILGTRPSFHIVIHSSISCSSRYRRGEKFCQVLSPLFILWMYRSLHMSDRTKHVSSYRSRSRRRSWWSTQADMICACFSSRIFEELLIRPCLRSEIYRHQIDRRRGDHSKIA